MNEGNDKKVIWAGRVVSVIAALPFAMSAAMKLMIHPEVVKGMSHLGMDHELQDRKSTRLNSSH